MCSVFVILRCVSSLEGSANKCWVTFVWLGRLSYAPLFNFRETLVSRTSGLLVRVRKVVKRVFDQTKSDLSVAESVCMDLEGRCLWKMGRIIQWGVENAFWDFKCIELQFVFIYIKKMKWRNWLQSEDVCFNVNYIFLFKRIVTVVRCAWECEPVLSHLWTFIVRRRRGQTFLSWRQRIYTLFRSRGDVTSGWHGLAETTSRQTLSFCSIRKGWLISLMFTRFYFTSI